MSERTRQASWGRFVGHPRLAHVTDVGLEFARREHSHQRTHAILTRQFSFIRANGERWTGRAGEIIDGTSVPRWLWSATKETPFTGRASWPALLHDLGCADEVLVNGQRVITRRYRDMRVHRVFYEGLRSKGMPHWKARVFYVVVVVHGYLRRVSPTLMR